jgi:hypothetical protein
MNTTTSSPIRSRRTRFALAASGGLVAITTATAIATGGFGKVLAEGAASDRGSVDRDHPTPCRLYESDAPTWGNGKPQPCRDTE